MRQRPFVTNLPQSAGHLILWGLAATVFAGCVSNPPLAQAPLYISPTSGPTARLLLRINHTGGRYTVSSFAQPLGCSHRQEFVSATVREPERQIVTLPANRLQTLSFMHVRDDRQSCQVIVSFEPRAGNTYLMRNTADAKGCTVELVNASNPEVPMQERSRIVRERVGMGLNDNACKPLTSTVSVLPAKGAAPEVRGASAVDSLEPFKDLLPGK
jgi:hypothetical protein